MDMDRQIDDLTAYGYTGHTVMHSRMPSGTKSRSSESRSSVDHPSGLVANLLQPDTMEKPPDLDKTVTMMDMPPVMPQAERKKMPAEEMPPDSDKKKKTKKKKKVKRGEAAGVSASTPRKAGPKATMLQEAMDEIALRELLDTQLGPLAEPAPLGVQAPAISL